MTRKDVAKLFKRFLILFACMLPLFILVGYLLYNRVSDIVMIIIFVVLAGAGFALEELVHYKLYQKRKALKEEKEKNSKK